MHQKEERRIDKILNEALLSPDAYSFVKDSDGNNTTFRKLNEKAVRRIVSDENIPENRIASFLKNENASINSSNTTQLAFDTLEANKKTQAATIAHQKAVEITRLAGVEKATTLATQRHGELLAKAEQTYNLELERYKAVMADRAATKADKALAATKLEKTKTNRAILTSISNQMDQKDEFGVPLLSAEDYLNLANQMEKMVMEGEIIDPGLITTAGARVIEGKRIAYDMQNLAEADAVAADAGESKEVKLENARNKMRLLLPRLPVEKRSRYESLSPADKDNWLRNELEGFQELRDQGKPSEPGSDEDLVFRAIGAYFDILDLEYARFGDLKDTFETPEERSNRINASIISGFGSRKPSPFTSETGSFSPLGF
jgi:hypothetical protein